MTASLNAERPPGATDKCTATKEIIRIGTAGWSVPSQHRERFAAAGSQLETYGSVLNCVEVNSSFYTPHRLKTYERWAASVPPDFRFAVKIPKAVSHAPGLSFVQSDVDRFLSEVSGLGVKLGVLLLQLPPTSAFDESGADPLISWLQGQVTVPIVCEPRHASWFMPEVETWLAERRVARVAADPARFVGAGEPGAWNGLVYFRLHGSPRIYYSSYDDENLRAMENRLTAIAARSSVWCIFDNTAAGAAMDNVLALKQSIRLT